MQSLPCQNCQYFNTYSGNYVSCLAVDDVDFYAYADIADMINQCPRGYRAKKVSDKQTNCWREYDKVRIM